MEFFWLQKMEPFEKTSRFAASFFGRLFLVGGFNPVEKSSDWIISPSRGENFKNVTATYFFSGEENSLNMIFQGTLQLAPVQNSYKRT